MSDWCQGCDCLLKDGECAYWGEDTYGTTFCSMKYGEGME